MTYKVKKIIIAINKQVYPMTFLDIIILFHKMKYNLMNRDNSLTFYSWQT